MYLQEIKSILADALGLEPGLAAALTADSALMGGIPELDSMGVVQLLAALEAHFGFGIGDDEVDANTFATAGTLAAFVQAKLAA